MKAKTCLTFYSIVLLIALTLVPSGAKGSEIELKNEGFGFTVAVTLNGKVTKPLLIDTGSSFVVISKETASKLGFKNLEQHPKYPISTAKGVSWGRLVVLEKVTVGGYTEEKIEALVHEKLEGNFSGLLGGSFLSGYKYRMNGNKGTFFIEPRGDGSEWLNARYERYVSAMKRFGAYKDAMSKSVAEGRVDSSIKFTEKDLGQIVEIYGNLIRWIDKKG